MLKYDLLEQHVRLETAHRRKMMWPALKEENMFILRYVTIACRMIMTMITKIFDNYNGDDNDSEKYDGGDNEHEDDNDIENNSNNYNIIIIIIIIKGK